ncbi:hypothetical protein [Aestuariibacter sp. A3R04]|uniref:hypothetical protein n=1 Tax=Aestuariibacter sp. A3R04 TaxID=2841571 RepID=UPI001C07F0AE|nr:hypothetical protein [Aestuariibacter sp. A3R04]MBU3021670.1 hypothetical protein [Aestuariibacter sp. A3R04]
MKNYGKMYKYAVAVVLCICSVHAVAQTDELPYTAGNYWEVSGIEVMPGQSLNYANHLAKQWKKYMDFAKKKGWIVDYKVLANLHPREGEPDLYLVTVFEKWVSNAEYDKRYDEYVAYMKTTNEELEEQSGERVVMRKLKSDILLMEYTLK